MIIEKTKYKCHTCGSSWDTNYCPECAQTICDEVKKETLEENKPTKRWVRFLLQVGTFFMCLIAAGQLMEAIRKKSTYEQYKSAETIITPVILLFFIWLLIDIISGFKRKKAMSNIVHKCIYFAGIIGLVYAFIQAVNPSSYNRFSKGTMPSYEEIIQLHNNNISKLDEIKKDQNIFINNTENLLRGLVGDEVVDEAKERSKASNTHFMNDQLRSIGYDYDLIKKRFLSQRTRTKAISLITNQVTDPEIIKVIMNRINPSIDAEVEVKAYIVQISKELDQFLSDEDIALLCLSFSTHDKNGKSKVEGDRIKREYVNFMSQKIMNGTMKQAELKMYKAFRAVVISKSN